MIQLTLTLKITTAQVVEMSVTVNKNSLIQDYGHPHDHTQLAHKMTPGFKPFTALLEVMEKLSVSSLRMLCSHEVHISFCSRVQAQNWYVCSHTIGTSFVTVHTIGPFNSDCQT